MSDTVKSDEDILYAATEAARDDFGSDPRWNQLSQGELTEQEEQEFRSLAERNGAIALFEACKPSTKEQRDRLYQPVMALMNPGATTNPPPPAVVLHPKAATVPSHTRLLRRFAPYVATGLAAAAALALVFRPHEPAPIASLAVPEFDLDPLRGDTEHRAVAPTESAVPRFGPDSHFNLVFRPKHNKPAEGKLETRSVLLQGDLVRAWNPDVDLNSTSGVGHITGRVGELFSQVPSGQWRICLLVGRPEKLPKNPDDVAQKCRSPEESSKFYWPLQHDIVLQNMGMTGHINDTVVPPLIIETQGCRRVRQGPICTVPASRKLNLWAKTNVGTDLHLLVDAEPVSATQIREIDGSFVPLELPPGAKNLFLKATVGSNVVGTYRLQLEEEEPLRELEAVEAREDANDYDGALSLVASLANDSRPYVRAQAKRKQARIERMKGNAAQAITLLNESINVDRAQGLISHEIDDRLLLLFTLLMNSTERLDRFAKARDALDGIDALAAQSPEGHAMIPYFRGLHALETGDLVRSRKLFRTAYDSAVRVHNDDIRQASAQALADALSVLGRFSEARDLLREVEKAQTTSSDPCAIASVLTDIGWMLRAARRGGAAGDSGENKWESPRQISEKALSIFRSGCKQPTAIANVLANLALMAIDEGKLKDARQFLDEAHRATPKPTARVEVDWLLAEAHLALSSKNPQKALNLFDKVNSIAERDGGSPLRVDATLGRARALDALGKIAAAGEAYAEANALVDNKSLLVPMGDGRMSFLASYEEVARHQMSYLLRRANATAHGRANELRTAMNAARQHRAHVLAAMQWMDRINNLDAPSRAEWERAIAEYRSKRKSLDDQFAKALNSSTTSELELARRKYNVTQQELMANLNKVLGIVSPTTTTKTSIAAQQPQLLEEELLLIYHPTVDGWIGFAATKSDVVAVPLSQVTTNMEPAELSEKLLAPFRASIERSSRIRFAAYGSLDRIRFHALPWKSRALIDHAPVTYGLDLPAKSGTFIPENGARHAVVVADSRDDLPHARMEARTISQQLIRRGWQVTQLTGDDATHEALQRALDQSNTALLHIAGHAVVEGVDGWMSAIPLSRGGAFTLSDIVARPRVPRLVVLSTCSGNTSGLPGDKSVLTLAQAFVVAGAAQVVAAVDTLNSAQAQSMMTHFYEAFRTGAAPDAPVLLQAAMLKAVQDPKLTEWATFRVVVP